MESITLVCRSGSSPDRAWSGIPNGLMRGLRELGLSAVYVDAEPKRPLVCAAEAWTMLVHRNRYGGMLAPEIRELRRHTARLRARTVMRGDAVVQMGSDFGVPFPERFVTLEDLTVAQLARVASIETALGARALRRWIEAQARCYQAAVGCCVASCWAADSVVLDYGIDPSKVHVVGFGRNHEPRAADRDWSRPRFLFVGYEWERKNGPQVLRAFARIRARLPKAQLDVVGDHPPIDADGVVGHGRLDFSDTTQRAQVETLFESATCFVMPSKYEPFGMVYVEAAAAGIPSIGTTVGGASDILGDDAGLIVDPTSEEALINAMLAMCNPHRAAAMGAAALKRSRLFTWKAVAARIAHALGMSSPEVTNTSVADRAANGYSVWTR